MRISSLSFYNSTTQIMQDQQSGIGLLSRKIAEQKNFLSAREAPVDASRAMELSESLAKQAQLATNQLRAQDTLKYESTILTEMANALSSLQQVVADAKSSQDVTLRRQAAQQLNLMYTHLKDLANTRDDSGNYIFAGHQVNTKPFNHAPAYDDSLTTFPTDSPKASYAGDEGLRAMEIADGRSVQTSDTLQGVMQTRDPAGVDLLEAIDQLAIDLVDPNATNTLASIDTATSSINTAIKELNKLQTGLAGRQVQVRDAKDATSALQLIQKNALGNIQELDTAAAIIELQQRQTVLQASQQVFSQVSKLTLFDYI